ncbi:MAG: DNA-protecting protein DprA [Deltaproteobacteria bacterium]|nr:DNA-protecting protein DprA [Deltaproteobacteria bacterium]
MSLRPYYALSHVVSQILGRYLSVNVPVEHCSQRALFSSGENGIEQWKRPDWDEFLRSERGKPSGLLPWLNLYMDRYDSQGALLLTKLWFHLRWCRDEGARYLLLCDPSYPEVLREIPQAPLALSVVGDLAVFAMPRVSVVGSRRTAQVALQESYRVGFMLSQLGVVVVSGGAYGCDIATHQGVLAAGGEPIPAIIAFANGLARLFPQGNRPTFNKIRDQGGLLVSERLWDQVPKPYDFPIRNRIISGLSMWTIVMGAAKQSGAMVTARLALDQGREVAVYVPAENRYFCEGCQNLVEDGAGSFGSAEEFCEQLRM